MEEHVLEPHILPFEQVKPVVDLTGSNSVASWREDFIGALPTPDPKGQAVYKWAADIRRALAMKGYQPPYHETVSKRVFPILVKMFRPRNWASIPATDLTEFLDYLEKYDKPKHRTLSLFEGVSTIKVKPSVAYHENYALIKADQPDLDDNMAQFLAWSAMVAGLPKLVKISDAGRKLGKTYSKDQLEDLDDLYVDMKDTFKKDASVNMLTGLNDFTGNTSSSKELVAHVDKFNAQGFKSRGDKFQKRDYRDKQIDI